MTDYANADVADGSHWDRFWRGSAGRGAYAMNWSGHPDIAGFWRRFFVSLTPTSGRPKILDVACGSGELIAGAAAAMAGRHPVLVCVDNSREAIGCVARRPGRAMAAFADARRLPFADASFDAVTSQFGVEYAGADAFFEAARVVAVDGRLACLIHSVRSHIHEDCSTSIDALVRILDARFLAKAGAMFDAGIAAVRGAPRGPYDQAAARLAPAVRVLESILTTYGSSVAGGLVARLYRDIADMHENIQTLDADATMEWFATMRAELEAYTERMTAMRKAALDEQQFTELRDQLGRRSMTIAHAGLLRDRTSGLPLAWSIVAVKEHPDRTTPRDEPGSSVLPD